MSNKTQTLGSTSKCPLHKGLNDVTIFIFDFIHCSPEPPVASKLKDTLESCWIHILRSMANFTGANHDVKVHCLLPPCWIVRPPSFTSAIQPFNPLVGSPSLVLKFSSFWAPLLGVIPAPAFSRTFFFPWREPPLELSLAHWGLLTPPVSATFRPQMCDSRPRSGTVPYYFLPHLTSLWTTLCSLLRPAFCGPPPVPSSTRVVDPTTHQEDWTTPLLLPLALESFIVLSGGDTHTAFCQ